MEKKIDQDSCFSCGETVKGDLMDFDGHLICTECWFETIDDLREMCGDSEGGK